ncbi:hypothetical protein NERG_01470 [Nematocida ausubeli]|uniref:Uncharacterized protein n=1 Tax=Nematocida ausubeli (strain ATCC PRA-371 / ERTm2) TaxID=1913371 RepID=H8ZCM7_NEMA1|nr:hypothetical protein NERG_01470 [Nematocida ausubeli]
MKFSKISLGFAMLNIFGLKVLASTEVQDSHAGLNLVAVTKDSVTFTKETPPAKKHNKSAQDGEDGDGVNGGKGGKSESNPANKTKAAGGKGADGAASGKGADGADGAPAEDAQKESVEDSVTMNYIINLVVNTENAGKMSIDQSTIMGTFMKHQGAFENLCNAQYSIRFLKKGCTDEQFKKDGSGSIAHDMKMSVNQQKLKEFFGPDPSSVSCIPVSLEPENPDSVSDLVSKYNDGKLAEEYFLHISNISTPHSCNDKGKVEMKAVAQGLYSSMFKTSDLVGEINTSTKQEKGGFLSQYWKPILVGCGVIVVACVVIGVLVNRNK